MKKKRNYTAARDHEEGQTVESYWPRGRSAHTSLDPSRVSAVCSGNVTASRRDQNKSVGPMYECGMHEKSDSRTSKFV